MAEEDSLSVLSLLSTFFSYFINGILLFIVFYLLYKIYKSRGPTQPVYKPEPDLPKFKKRDFTVEELKPYNGSSTAPDGRILIGINGKVFDVTTGRMHYGPDGPYSVFAGRDASRGLATFNIAECKEEYDDLSDLKPYELDSLREWEMQIKEKYTYVGKLLKPGEEPSVYSDDEGDGAPKIKTSSPSESPSPNLSKNKRE